MAERIADGSLSPPNDNARTASKASRTDGAATSMRTPVPTDDSLPAEDYDGIPVRALRDSLGVPAVHLFARVGSTLDLAHEMAAGGAPDGTLILADMQTRGRGRTGKRWASPPGSGIWLTLVARPTTMDSIRVLTVRLGLAAAAVLDDFSAERIGLKWPNDLFVGARKLAGTLVEARWRAASPEWLAVGFGVNVAASADAPAAGHLKPSVSRVAVLRALVPALRAAVARTEGELNAAELETWASRDFVAGRAIVGPVGGVVAGIDRTAALLVTTDAGPVAISSGSLVLSEES